MDDVIENWLDLTKTYGVVVARSLLPKRWAVTMPARPAVALHLLARGDAYVQVKGEPAVHIAEGGFVLVPHGREHVLSDSIDTRARPLEEFARNGAWQGPHASTLICGEYRSDLGLSQALTQQLPEVVLFTREQIAADAALSGMLQLLCSELESARPGRGTVLEHLLGALLACALRSWSSAADAGWPAALADPALAPVLRAIHERPAEQWTVQTLADIAHLSRAAFARRFRSVVGQPPLEYLTRVRMAVASRHLRGNAKLSEVAQAVGYTSEFAFSRAFKRTQGQSPALYRA